MSKKRKILFHVGGCIIFIIYSLVGMLLYDNKFNTAVFNFMSTFTIIKILEFYLCYLFILPSYFNRKKPIQLIIGILLSIMLFIAIRYLIEEVIIFKLLGYRNNGQGFNIYSYILYNTYNAVAVIFVAIAVYSTEKALNREKENAKLKQEAAKAELAFLKSQINPHFLYNTLNYIYSLAIPVSQQLATAIIRLSDLMRYTLQESEDGKVLLAKEIEYIESYIELFKMRFAPNFYVDFNIIGKVNQQKITALLLIPFVENAFKHGIVNNPDKPVTINLTVNDNKLQFELSNYINQQQKDQSSGIGLNNIRKRLNLIYPGQHQLVIKDDGKFYQSSLQITLN